MILFVNTQRIAHTEVYDSIAYDYTCSIIVCYTLCQYWADWVQYQFSQQTIELIAYAKMYM